MAAHPYPVPLKVFDETIRVVKSAVLKAKLGLDEEMQALKRLDSQARQLEAQAEGPSLESFITVERAASPGLDGRSCLAGKATCQGRRPLAPSPSGPAQCPVVAPQLSLCRGGPGLPNFQTAINTQPASPKHDDCRIGERPRLQTSNTMPLCPSLRLAILCCASATPRVWERARLNLLSWRRRGLARFEVRRGRKSICLLRVGRFREVE